MTKTKTCSGCKSTQPIDQFNRRRESRDGRRGQCKRCMNSRAKAPTVEEQPAGGGKLPVGPFRAWLEGRLAYYGDSTELLGIVTGLGDRQIRRILRENKTISLDLVDRALIKEGTTPLWALEYSEEDFQKAARASKKAAQAAKRKAAAK